jgi:hypothetical protein
MLMDRIFLIVLHLPCSVDDLGERRENYHKDEEAEGVEEEVVVVGKEVNASLIWHKMSVGFYSSYWTSIN